MLGSGDVVRAYLASEVVDDRRLADMMQKRRLFDRRGCSKMQQKKYKAVYGVNKEPAGQLEATGLCRRWYRGGCVVSRQPVAVEFP